MVGLDKSISVVRCVSTTKYPVSVMMLEDISDLRCVSTTKYPASAMMLGVMASNGGKCHLFGLTLALLLQGYLGLKNPPLGEKSN